MDYPNALIAMFAGAHRHAGADTDADGWKDSDVAHDTENLFHELTVYIANRGQAGSTRYWFAQIHGASDRASEPTIVGSNGADAPVLTSDSPLVQIDGAVDAAEYMTMGVCGWDEGAGDEEDGNYLLCATTNIQGDLLESLGLRQTFKHFEIERHARDDYHSGSGPGYDGILNLLQAITNVLNSHLK
jgi:hypothetical protein